MRAFPRVLRPPAPIAAQGGVADVPARRAGIALGAFVHGAPNDPGAIDRFAERIGRGLAIVSWFEAWGEENAVTGEVIRLELLQRVAERGAVPMIAWEPWLPGAGVEQPAYRLANIARGDFDAYANSWAYRLAAYGGPVLLRFAHEMNAPWYPWGIGVNGNDAASYVAAWRRLHARFAEAGATNVRWVWCVDAASLDEQPAAAAYPGDDVVDWLAFDAYNWGTTLPDTRWLTVPEAFGPAYEAVTGLGPQPVMVAETGCADAGGDKAAWIAEGFPAVPDAFPRIASLCWFEEERPTADWRIAPSPEATAAFAAAVAVPVWQARLGPDGLPTTAG